MDSKTISFQATSDDYMTVNRLLCRGMHSHFWIVVIVSTLLTGFLTYQILVFVHSLSFYQAHAKIIDGPLLALFFIVTAIMFHKVLKRYVASHPIFSPEGLYLISKLVRVDRQGFHEIGQNYETLIKWSGIMRIEDDAGYILFYIDLHAACLVPKRFFASSDEAEDFLNCAKILWEQARHNVLPDAVDGEAPSKGHDVWRVPRISSVKSTEET